MCDKLSRRISLTIREEESDSTKSTLPRCKATERRKSRVIGSSRKDEGFNVVLSGKVSEEGSSRRRKESLRKERGLTRSEGNIT